MLQQYVLRNNQEKNIVIGTHGTALSSIMNYYKPEFGCNDFLRIIDWMPYIVEMDFEGNHTENSVNDVFADVGKALVFFDTLVEYLATPIDLPYILEDKISG